MPSLAAVAPIENSPPGIQTIPSGDVPDGRAAFAMVGAKTASSSVCGGGSADLAERTEIASYFSKIIDALKQER